MSKIHLSKKTTLLNSLAKFHITKNHVFKAKKYTVECVPIVASDFSLPLKLLYLFYIHSFIASCIFSTMLLYCVKC